MNQIAIDVGNTRIKYGVFKGADLIQVGQVYQLDDLPAIVDRYSVRHAILSSVRHLEDQDWTHLFVTGTVVILSAKTPVPIINNYATPLTLGVDRLAAVVGASSLYRQQDCLVIDAGTCITYDFVDRNAAYHGGSIAPGLAMKYKALHTFTGKLPLVEQNEQNVLVPLIGRNTIECLRSGVLNGTLAEVAGLIAEYKQKSPDLINVLCGGDASFFEKSLKARIFVEPNLVLIGLNVILNYNV